jgi:hypothetical protein
MLVMVAALSIAGCTTPTNNTNQAATQHDAFLEKYLAVYKNQTSSANGTDVQAWELDWINSTSARLQLTEFNKTTNQTVNFDMTYVLLPSTQDATNYVNAMNLTAYALARTKYLPGAYQNVTGHPPQIYRKYIYDEGSLLNLTQYRAHYVEQFDNIVVVTTARYL